MMRDLARELSGEGIELRVPTGPSAPDLPLDVVCADRSGGMTFAGSGRVGAQSWARVREEARRRGRSSSAVLMSLVADALRLWSQQGDFELDLVLPGQWSEVPLVFEVLPQDSFGACAARLDDQLEQSSSVPWDAARPLGRNRLSFTIVEDGEDLVVTCSAEDGAGGAGLCRDLADVVLASVDRLAQSPATWEAGGRLAEVPLWQLQERAEANRTGANLPVTTLCLLVEERAETLGDQVAVIAADGELTYREVVSAARRLAQRLVTRGAGAGDVVGVVMDRVSAQVPVVLGVTLSGAAYVPVDPQWPAARRRQVLEQSGVRTVVTTSELRRGGGWPAGVVLLTLDDDRLPESGPCQSAQRPPGALASPQDLAYVIFTSGSTGQPKGVMVEHQAAANTVQDINRRFQIGPGDRILALSSLSFDLSVYDVFGSLAAGAAVVIPAPGRAHDPRHWSELVQRHAVTVWNSVPALMRLWLDDPSSGESGSRLRLVMLSGDRIPLSLPPAIRVAHPDAQVVSLGGATEASIWSVIFPIAQVPQSWARIPYGKPLTNQTLHVLDPDLRPRPVWAVGEIHIGGVGVARGYWCDAARTAERFVQDPSTGERLYRTGDLGRYLPGGDIEILGRADSQVKLNGYRIELDEIAAVLSRQPGVGAAAVTVETNPATDSRQLVAHVVAASGGPGAVPSSPDGPKWSQLVSAGNAELARARKELAPEISSFREMWQRLEAVAPSVMARTLMRVGAFSVVGDTVTAELVVARCGVREVYCGLVQQWLAVLAARGWLAATDRAGEYAVQRILSVDVLDAEISAALQADPAGDSSADPISSDASGPVLLDYFARCVDNQLGLLSGSARPLHLLMPDGDWRVTRALYATNPAAHLQNRVVASIVRSFVQATPGEAPVKILEVGAGTGATADQVLAAVPRARTKYHFTDLSTAFTTTAKSKYQGVHPQVSYGLFDIDLDAGRQGMAPGSIDVVVAANVLHDAKDLDAALPRIAELLSPGGLLVLIEGTVNSPLNLISFAFLEGFANSQGQRQSTLLSAPEWQERLRAAGFSRVAGVPEGEPAVDALAQHVLLGRAPTGVADSRPAPHFLDPEGLRAALTELLPEYMVPHHYLCLDHLPLSANGKIDLSGLRTPWDGAADPDDGQTRTAPRTDMERRLHAIWSEALGHDDFGVDDDFFELGGDSLHAVRIIGRLRAECGIEQAGDDAVDLLFQAPTVAALARVLTSDPAGCR